MKEGVFTTSYPDTVCQVFFYFLQGLGEAFVGLLLSDDDRQKLMQQAAILVAAYNDALERVLGAPSGSINLIDTETLEAWFPSPETVPLVPGKALTN
jgi:hypothetical protein